MEMRNCHAKPIQYCNILFDSILNLQDAFSPQATPNLEQKRYERHLQIVRAITLNMLWNQQIDY